MRETARLWRHFDLSLLAAVSALTITGVAMIHSAIAGNQYDLAGIDTRQAIFAAAGLVVVLITAAIDYRLWSAVSSSLYLIILALLGLMLVTGLVSFGAVRWFKLGIINIQPSELSKIFMILILSGYFARHQQELARFGILVRSLILVGVPVVLIFLQPDLSTAAVLLVSWLALAWASGIPVKHLAVTAGIGLAVVLVALPFLAEYFIVGYPKGENFLFLQHYQMQRLVSFLLPNPAVQHGDTYNVNQALIAIGSGGLLGQGYAHGTQVQLRFLKVRHTDFIFSALSEEFGFVGAVGFLLLLMFVIYRCLRTARMARDTYGALICYGVAILLLSQASFNIGMNLNLFPASGLPLPFLSYGGSSLLTSLLGVGLVESVALRQKRIEL
jgi:rod shape determining protein RodA